MRILHTADWHLNAQLGRINRQDDIVARLGEIATYLDDYQMDVLVVAGDMFSRDSSPEEMRDALGNINRVFNPFLLRGGTIVAISGNHDNEAMFNLMRFALDLAAPLDPRKPGPRPRGRLYLAAQPTYLLLEDAARQQVQFALMPYPTSARYLRDEGTRYGSTDEKNRLLHQALIRKLDQLKQKIDQHLPSVLVAHVHVRGSQIHNLYEMTERDDVIFEPGDIPTQWAYVAYGHIHKPQALPGATHVCYAGSIERLDYAEQEEKSVVLVEVCPTGRVGDPVHLPLNATPIYRVEILNPETEMPGLRDRYPDTDRALVSWRLVYKPGEHNRDEICRELEAIFPRWYHREVVARGSKVVLEGTVPTIARDVPGTVRGYLQERLANNQDRDDLLALADQLLSELEVGG